MIIINNIADSSQCKETRKGLDYRGSMAYTTQGRQCLPWTQQNISSLAEQFADYDNSYCRNPDKDPIGPWCFIDTFKRQYCPIPICQVSNDSNNLYITNPQNSFIKTKLRGIGEKIHIVFYPICFVIGTVLNSFSVAATSFILNLLAVIDTLALYTRFPLSLRLVSGWKLDAATDLSCRIYWYLHFVISCLSSWLLVFITCERVVAISKPHKAKLVFTRRNAFIICVCVLISLIILNGPVLWGQQAVTDFLFDADDVHFVTSDSCRLCCLMENTLIIAVIAMVTVLLPFSIILMGNIIIIVYLITANKKRQSMLSSTKAKEDFNKLISLTKTLVSVTFTYLILTLPFLVYSLVLVRSVGYFGDAYFWNAITLSLFNINNSINFLLYCFGGKNFREEFLKMFVCKSYFGTETNTETSKVSQSRL